MSMHCSWKSCLTVGMVALGSALSTFGVSLAKADPTSGAVTVASGSESLTLASSTVMSNGDIQTTWDGPGQVTVSTVSAPNSSGATISLSQPTANEAEVVVTPDASAASTSESDAADAANTIKDGELYNSIPTTTTCSTLFVCTTGDMTQTMFQNISRKVYTGQLVQSSGYSFNTDPITLSEAYDRWPGSSGDARVRQSPNGTTTTTTNVATVNVSTSYNHFSVGASFPVNRYSSVGPVTPSGSDQPAFGAAWRGSNSSSNTNPVYEAADSANTVHIGRGQSNYAELVVVNAHG